MTSSGPVPRQRITLTLRKPWITWFSKPTVVFGERGQPAQWGSGTWQAPVEGPTIVRIFLFNRLWKYGAAEVVIGGDLEVDRLTLVYTAPWLPFLSGTLKRSS